MILMFVESEINVQDMVNQVHHSQITDSIPKHFLTYLKIQHPKHNLI